MSGSKLTGMYFLYDIRAIQSHHRFVQSAYIHRPNLSAETPPFADTFKLMKKGEAMNSLPKCESFELFAFQAQLMPL